MAPTRVDDAHHRVQLIKCCLISLREVFAVHHYSEKRIRSASSSQQLDQSVLEDLVQVLSWRMEPPRGPAEHRQVDERLIGGGTKGSAESGSVRVVPGQAEVWRSDPWSALGQASLLVC